MTKKECGNGHIYDADIHDSCPYCRNQKGTIVFPPSPRKEDGGSPTMPAENPLREVPKVECTMPEMGTTPVMRARCGFDPVAGWLVGVDGSMAGRSVELMAWANRIGRSAQSDVRIPEDPTVSWEDHACIDYDRMTHTFTLIPGRFVNTIYLNGEALYAPRYLKAYDRVLLGETEMMFIPFCGEEFQWSGTEMSQTEPLTLHAGFVPMDPDPTEPAEPIGRVYRREVEEGATLMMGGNDNES